MAVNLKKNHLTVPIVLTLLAILVAIALAFIGNLQVGVYVADAGIFLFLLCGYAGWQWLQSAIESGSIKNPEKLRPLFTVLIWLNSIYELCMFATMGFADDFVVLRINNPYCALTALLLLFAPILLEWEANFGKYRHVRYLLYIVSTSIFTAVSVVMLLAD